MYVSNKCDVFLVDKNGNIKRRFWPIKGVNINCNGYDNIITIHEEINFNNCKLNIVGNNNKFYIDSTKKFIKNLVIDTWGSQYINFTIDKEFQCGGVNFFITQDDININIGKNCMFSWDINFWIGYSHSIINLESFEIQKEESNILNIADNVWLGHGVTITKPINISQGSIVATKSILTKSIKQENCLIAGMPAKIVKKNVTWFYPQPNWYENIIKDDCPSKLGFWKELVINTHKEDVLKHFHYIKGLTNEKT